MTNVTELPAEDDRAANIEVLARVAGRSQSVITEPPNSTSSRIMKMFQGYAPLGNGLPFEILDHIELIARYNPDFSQAVENLKTLSNSGHEVIVMAQSELAQRRALAYFNDQARLINPSHGGVDGLIDKLLWQASVFGAMCGEWILNEKQNEVIDFADISPKKIRFFWDVDNEYNGWAPYQKVNADQGREAESNGQKVRDKIYVRLNPITFHYYAFDPPPNTPYGMPPFVSALRPISIQDDLVENMAKIVKKMGLLALVDMSVEALAKANSETQEQYVLRATQFLTQYSEAMEDMIQEGGMVHFDDATIQSHQITGNGAGATNIFKQNEEQVFSGLKSMPSLQGRSYSTTETYAGVAYDITIRNTQRYQRAIKRLIESGYWLMADLAGVRSIESISLQFHPNKTLQRLQNSQARVLEIKAVLMLWAMGVINQNDAAAELGYQTVREMHAEIPESAILGNASPGGGAGTTSTDTSPANGPPANSDDAPSESNLFMSQQES